MAQNGAEALVPPVGLVKGKPPKGLNDGEVRVEVVADEEVVGICGDVGHAPVTQWGVQIESLGNVRIEFAKRFLSLGGDF